jgi:hypothetical protein
LAERGEETSWRSDRMPVGYLSDERSGALPSWDLIKLLFLEGTLALMNGWPCVLAMGFLLLVYLEKTEVDLWLL